MELQKHTTPNAAGIEFYSMYQANSLFTLSAVFKDGNKTKCHSWRQEIRSKELKVDQEHAWKRLYQLATVCTCRNDSKKCFACNHKVLTIYCNLTDQPVYKAAYQKMKYMADLHFATGESTGNNYLIHINETKVFNLAREHAKKNFTFNQFNK